MPLILLDQCELYSEHCGSMKDANGNVIKEKEGAYPTLKAVQEIFTMMRQKLSILMKQNMKMYKGF